MLPRVLRRAWGDFLWWLDGLSALQAVAGYLLLGGVATGVLLATIGRTTGSYMPFVLAFGLFILHCTRRAEGAWNVFGCGTGPGALVAIVDSVFSLHGLVTGILGG